MISSFGEKGALHLGTGAEREPGAPRPAVTLNTPGAIYRDMYITTGIMNTAASVRAYDVRSGAVKWAFHLIPRQGEVGYDTWPAGGPGRAGGAANWTGSVLDEVRGIVYVPTESATPDFWAGERDGQNLFANSLVALDANTGKRIWHQQIVHHDMLDKDLPTPPVLLTVTHRGRRIDAVAQGTKHGPALRFQSRDRRAPLAHRGTAGRTIRPSWRQDVANAAVSDQARPAHAPDVYGQRCVDRFTRGACDDTTEIQCRRLTWCIPTAESQGDDPLSGLRRRHGVGRRGCRPAGQLLRQRE